MTGFEETGVVIKTSGDTALVRVEEGEKCSTCSSRTACSQEEPSSAQKIVEALNPIGVKTGQRVQIHIESSDILKASILMFAVPLLSLLGGSLLGNYLGRYYSEDVSVMLTIFSGLVFMGSAFFVIHIYNNNAEKRKAYYPNITKVIG